MTNPHHPSLHGQTFTTIELEKLRVIAEHQFDPRHRDYFGMLPSVEVDTRVRRAVEMLCIRLQQEVYSQKFRPIILRNYATWQDGLREWLYAKLWIHWPWFIEWLKERYPVRFQETVIDEQAYYPMLNFPHERVVLPTPEKRGKEVVSKGEVVSEGRLRRMYKLADPWLRQYGQWRMGREVYHQLVRMLVEKEQYIWKTDDLDALMQLKVYMGIPIFIDRYNDEVLELERKPGA